ATATVKFNIVVNAVPTPANFVNVATITYSDPTGPTTTTVTGPTGGTTITAGNVGNLGNSTKGLDDAQAKVGSIINFTVTVVNTGTANATNILVRDNFTTGISFVAGSAQVNGIALPLADTTSGIPIASIAPGVTVIVNFKALVTAIPTPNPFVNTAVITYNNGSGPATSTITGGITNVTPGPVGNLGGSTKSINNSTPSVGDTVIYTAVIKNTGSLTVTNVLVKDALTPGINFVNGSLQLDGVPDVTANIVTGYVIPSIAPGTVKTVQFSAKITAIPNPNPFVNAIDLLYNDGTGTQTPNRIVGGGATVSAGGGGGNLSDSTKSIDDTQAKIGSTVNYTVTIVNTGSQAATNVLVRDNFTSGISFVPGSVQVNGVSIPSADPNIGVSIASIAPGATVIVNFKALVTAIPTPNPYINTAIITYNTGTGPATSTITGGGTNVTPGPVGNLGASTKSINNSTPSVGDTVIYTALIRNTGSLTVTNVTVKDALTQGFNFVTGSLQLDGVSDPAANIVTGYVIPSIAPGTVKTVQFSAKITAIPNPNPFVNAVDLTYNDGTGRIVPNHIVGGGATVSAGGGGGNLSDSTKSIDDTNAKIGSTVNYTVTIVNTGSQAATGVLVRDNFTNGIVFVPGSVQVNGFTIPSADPNVGVSIASIAPGATYIVSFKANIVAIPSPNPYINTAIITYNTGTGPATSTITGGGTNVTPGPVGNLGGSTKSINNSTPSVGDTVIYTAVIKNTG
ncbi:MAG: beta strand repeat-containing protein, partial [Clostridium sp.]